MSGLLDKAKTSAEESTEAKKVEKKSSSGLLTKTNLSPQKDALVNADGPDIPLILNLVGWAIIVVGGILSLQGGGFGLIVVLVVLALGIGSIVQSQRMSGGLSRVKTGLSVALAFVIAVGPYAAVMIVPTNASMAITEVSLNEDEDEISFVVRGSFSKADAQVFVDGVEEELWSSSKSLSNDRATFYIPIGSIFAGNALDYTATVVKQYTIEVESSDGQKSSIDIDSGFLTREAKNSAVSIFKIVKTSNDGSNTNSVTDGISIDAAVGLFSPNEQALDDGDHTLENTALIPVASDYTFNIVIKKGSNVVYSNMPIITVNGISASWSSPMSGSQSGDTTGWISMPGTAQNDVAEYLQKDDFYDNSGCYTFELTISNQYSEVEGASTYTSSNSWDLDWDDTDSTQDGAMTAC